MVCNDHGGSLFDVASEFLDRPDNEECFSFGGGVIPLCVCQEVTGVFDWMFIGSNGPNGSRRKQ